MFRRPRNASSASTRILVTPTGPSDPAAAPNHSTISLGFAPAAPSSTPRIDASFVSLTW